MSSDSDPDSESEQLRNETQPDDLSNYKLTRDRVRREIKAPSRYSDTNLVYYAFCVAEQVEYADPNIYKEAMNNRERDKRMKTTMEETDSLLKNGTWILVDRVQGIKVVSYEWIFKIFLQSTEAERIRFKAQLVVMGFTQEQIVDFNDVFSPVVKHSSIRILLPVVAERD